MMRVKGYKLRANPGKRRNPDAAAAERYEFFHGRPPDAVEEFTEKIHYHSVLSGIGKLKQLVIAAVDGKTEVTLSNFKGSVLSQNEAGTQLFISGGDQSVNLADFGVREPHESEVLGAALLVTYHTMKDHLRPEDGGTGNYEHRFGGSGSRLPVVVYDVVNKKLSFSGGGYTLPRVGIHG